MYITRMHLPRRAVLRGLGATVALPLLDCMVPALSAQSRTAAAPIKRVGVFYVPNGMAMEFWTPKSEGHGFQLSPILEQFVWRFRSFTVCSQIGDSNCGTP